MPTAYRVLVPQEKRAAFEQILRRENLASIGAIGRHYLLLLPDEQGPAIMSHIRRELNMPARGPELTYNSKVYKIPKSSNVRYFMAGIRKAGAHAILAGERVIVVGWNDVNLSDAIRKARRYVKHKLNKAKKAERKSKGCKKPGPKPKKSKSRRGHKSKKHKSKKHKSKKHKSKKHK
jgi:hypothetical protein